MSYKSFASQTLPRRMPVKRRPLSSYISLMDTTPSSGDIVWYHNRNGHKIRGIFSHFEEAPYVDCGWKVWACWENQDNDGKGTRQFREALGWMPRQECFIG